MREVHRSQFQLGQVPIEEIWINRINPKSRDDIPAVLKGLQHIWCDEALREQLFALLDEHILPEADRTVGRPGRVILGHAPPGPTPPRPAQGTADAQDPAHRDIHRGGHNY